MEISSLIRCHAKLFSFIFYEKATATLATQHQTIELHEYLFNLSDNNVMLFSA
jgi:hypothetical protein